MELEVGAVSCWLLFLKTPHGGSGERSHGCQCPVLGQRHKPRGGSGQVPSSGELWRWLGGQGFQATKALSLLTSSQKPMPNILEPLHLSLKTLILNKSEG